MMRIATPQIYQNATSQMLEQQANLNKTQVQLGSGKKSSLLRTTLPLRQK